ncbi:MAG: helix-turn-helix domain-containing protein [Tyzzerella sp.]|nr:helix-turn-helix domain-containing protein [Tyzzerella sp.]
MYTILVIDDEPIIADSIAKLLSDSPGIGSRCNVFKAYNTYEASFIIQNENVDIIVSDIKMSGMDGIAFRNSLVKQNLHIQFLFISGYTDFDDIYNAIKYPGTRFLLKSEDDDVIIKNVIELIDALPPQNACITIDDHFAKKVYDFVEDHLEYEGCLSAVADHMNMNPSYLSRLYKKITGENFSKMVCRLKIEKSKQMLSDTNERISDIGNAVGFVTPSSFAYFFKKNVGITPKQYRQQAQQSLWKNDTRP